MKFLAHPPTNWPSTQSPRTDVTNRESIAHLQIFNGSHLQTNIESQISAMAYLDLMLRSMTEPGLLRIFVRFLLDEEKFDGQRVLDILIERINATDARVNIFN